MDILISYLNSGHSIIDLLISITVIAAVIVCIEKTIKWVYDLLIKWYKKKKGKEDDSTTLDKNTKEIQKLSDSIDNLAELLNNQYQRLDIKIDEQKERISKIDEDGKRRDRSLMRDRLVQGLRYFSQQKDEKGIVHISMTDYENLEELFNEYFKCGGNGVCHSLYENEFKKFKIDTERKY